MPKDVLGKGLTASALKQLDLETGVAAAEDDAVTLTSRVSQLSIRNKHETTAEKKERKKAFKEYKREMIVQRKANEAAFKEETQRQKKNAMNNARNVQGQKLL